MGRILFRRVTFLLWCTAAFFAVGCKTTQLAPAARSVARWQQFEHEWKSSVVYTNPIQQAELNVRFTAPSGKEHQVLGFWDGAAVWKVRFSPNEAGAWRLETSCTDARNKGLHKKRVHFTVSPPSGTNVFERHGPIRLSDDRHFFVHDDGTPFFWLGDTVWNGPLLSTEEDWGRYLHRRRQQKFSAVQWVSTQWRAAPKGDRSGLLAFSGKEQITIEPKFFQQLDQKVAALQSSGMLSVPVLLWAIPRGENSEANPGTHLPESEAIKLAKYMVARWQGRPTVWLLNGDGDYRGTNAARWKNIGRAVFSDISHAPVSLHPGGGIWELKEFKDETWLDVVGYQSGHSEGDPNLKWITSGPASAEWTNQPTRPFISLEAPYEASANTSGKPISAAAVRRAHYWSLLNAPVAGITYGAHGVWGWDAGGKPPVGHSRLVPAPVWSEALELPGAQQMTHLHDFFRSIDFWRLRPAPEVLGSQPGEQHPARFISAARIDREMLVLYTPEERTISVKIDQLPPNTQTEWFNPQTGERHPGIGVVTDTTVEFPTQSAGDWLLILKSAKK